MSSPATQLLREVGAHESALGDGSPVITKTTDGYQLHSSLLVPRPRSEVFEFFSKAENLSTLTPEFVKFQIKTPTPVAMHEGARIDYRITVRHIPMRWSTEIVAWDPPVRFIDRQDKGPYRRWLHEHRFTETPRGTLCEDRVDYSVYGGALVHALFVRRDVVRIFRYRAARLRELFPA